ncbi:hypothetical protein BVRB_9g211070 [Beta vulgaris subsp. vulgaris]|nr:hypothetical protein BVRB_9g211070 [Beta vulgaris subsp. vulgaris]
MQAWLYHAKTILSCSCFIACLNPTLLNFSLSALLCS